MTRNFDEADAKKKYADAETGFVTVIVSSAGLVSKCRIPVGAVATRGLVHILLGTNASSFLQILLL